MYFVMNETVQFFNFVDARCNIVILRQRKHNRVTVLRSIIHQSNVLYCIWKKGVYNAKHSMGYWIQVAAVCFRKYKGLWFLKTKNKDPMLDFDMLF